MSLGLYEQAWSKCLVGWVASPFLAWYVAGEVIYVAQENVPIKECY